MTYELLSDHQFEELSISRWAATELLGELYDKPFEDPIDVIDNFGMKMLQFRTEAPNPESERLFAIAAECAFDWVDIFKNW